MKILAIIVTYNGLQWYDRCLGSLLQSTIAVDCMVVDNASMDGSADYIEQHFPQVKLIRSKQNIGFGQANNIGLRYALKHQYDYAFLLNQDAWLYTHNTIEQLLKAAEQAPDYGIYSAIWLYGNAQRITKGNLQHIVAMPSNDHDMLSDLYLHRPLRPIYPTDSIGAAAWLLPRKTIEMIGGFDPLFFQRGEDDNYQQRVRYYGTKVGLCPMAAICHDIEYRPENYDTDHENKQKNLLVYLADPNHPKRLSQFKTQCLRKFILYILSFRWKKANEYAKIIAFVYRKEAQIQYSIHTNQQKGPHWL